jgi:hypothetical protein
MRHAQLLEYRSPKGWKSEEDPMQKQRLETARIASRTRSCCLVCGFTEIRTDEVVDHDILFLAECPRCDYRWTSREPIAAVVHGAGQPAAVQQWAPVRAARVPARVVREIAPAA